MIFFLPIINAVPTRLLTPSIYAAPPSSCDVRPRVRVAAILKQRSSCCDHRKYNFFTVAQRDSRRNPDPKQRPALGRHGKPEGGVGLAVVCGGRPRAGLFLRPKAPRPREGGPTQQIRGVGQLGLWNLEPPPHLPPRCAGRSLRKVLSTGSPSRSSPSPSFLWRRDIRFYNSWSGRMVSWSKSAPFKALKKIHVIHLIRFFLIQHNFKGNGFHSYKPVRNLRN